MMSNQKTARLVNKKNNSNNKNNHDDDNTHNNDHRRRSKAQVVATAAAATIDEDQILTKEFKYKIGFNQSVSTGVVAIEGYVHFDDGQAISSTEYFLLALQRFQNSLKESGYQLATEAAPKRIAKE